MSSHDTSPRPTSTPAPKPRGAGRFPPLKSQAEFAATATGDKRAAASVPPTRMQGLERVGVVLTGASAGLVAAGMAWAGF